ncbi:recombinase family protein [Branchiibius cervicis]|uniref:Recombinase family protein n=1 Tax=Branchiibius cervicis TaxID=908252 RepID=A0ABW2ANG3_9MICO
MASGPPPFGLRRRADGKLEHDPATYEAARAIADMALDGNTPKAIAAELNRRGIRPTRAEEWRAGSVRQLLLSPGFAGLSSLRERTAKGGWRAIAEVYLDAEGNSVSVGDGVITEAERERIRASIASRARATPTGKRGVRQPSGTSSLLRGLAVCAHCGSAASIVGKASGADPSQRSYACLNRRTGGSCEGSSAVSGLVDEAVTSTFLRRLSLLDPEHSEGDAELLAAIAQRWITTNNPEADAERQRLAESLQAREAAVENLLDLAESGALSGDRLRHRIERAEAARDLAARALSELPTPDADLAPLLDLAQSRDAWDALDLAERRRLLALGLSRVELLRAPVRGSRFRGGDRVRLVWHSGRAEPGGVPSERPSRLPTGDEVTALRALIADGDRGALVERVVELLADGVRATALGPALGADLGYGRSWADSIRRRASVAVSPESARSTFQDRVGQ